MNADAAFSFASLLPLTSEVDDALGIIGSFVCAAGEVYSEVLGVDVGGKWADSIKVDGDGPICRGTCDCAAPMR